MPTINPQLFQQLSEQIQKCRETLSINYLLLIDEHYQSFQKHIQNHNIEAATASAESMLYSIQRIEQFEWHKKIGNSIVAILNHFPPTPLLAVILRQLAVTYDLEKNFRVSEECFLKALEVIQPFAETNIEAKSILASLWHNRAQLARNGESNQELLKYNQKALKIYEEVNDNRGVVLSLNRISSLLEPHQVQERKDINQRALAIADKEQDEGMMVLAQMNLGMAEVELNNAAYGIMLIKNAITFIEKNASWRYIALAHLHLAEAFAKSGQMSEAQKTLNYAAQIFKQHGVEVYSDKIEEVQKLIVNV